VNRENSHNKYIKCVLSEAPPTGSFNQPPFLLALNFKIRKMERGRPQMSLLVLVLGIVLFLVGA
jgi:hypothetical protein